ncbi:MltA specific insert domain protein [Leptospira weilii serovar Ranarum str. ICFT]|uniref:peptidoglycan lytic exotransglycosylase n=1 Tax=Leptospira weilii serovar Ranarum str. ICFT TaxID=1218598 RepID=N1WKL4_9LEPT|nr:MltA domain-containing protein [Leptospira weilii]EMY77892.1 MltA specific insert domain protein [Leptospira weilii serovar Ranarum str. ICFT]
MRFLFVFICFVLINPFRSETKGLEESGFISFQEAPFVLHTEDLDSLHRALKESESYYKRLPSDWSVKIRNISYNKNEMLHSLKYFETILREKNWESRNIKFQNSFLILETADAVRGKITAYYEVLIEGKFRPEGEFIHPILEKPSDLIVKKEGNRKSVGKIVNGTFVPYETRMELSDPSVRWNKSKTIVFVKITDLHLAQLEGSALVKTPDQDPFRITYSSDNGKEYLSPAESLKGICKSLIPSDLRDCILEFPKEVEAAIFKNPRYVFFKREPTAPRGSGGIELIPKRSVAMDPNIPLGIPALISFESGVLSEKNRIVFVHDRGSQIMGHGRLDYFLGTGKTAEEKAGRIQTKGKILLILPKK